MAKATSIYPSHEEYVVEALSSIYIDEDADGCFAKVIGEEQAGFSYTVRLDDSQPLVVATSCNCTGYRFRKSACKHMNIVNAYFKRIYNVAASQKAKLVQLPTVSTKPSIAPQAASVQPNRNDAPLLHQEFGILKKKAS